MEKQQATVYFTEDTSPAGFAKILAPWRDVLSGNIGVKVHFGEEGNDYYVRPTLYKDSILELKGTFIESNVLYRGKRRFTESHISLAQAHGFGYAPIDIIDSEGETAFPYQGKHFSEIHIGKHLDNYDSFLVISHFKGHMVSGFGGAIKNVGMGLAAIPGKLEIHAGSSPNTHPASCVMCGKCTTVCPADAITLNPLKIDLSKCIACGKCIGECPTGSIRVPWGKTGENGFLERLVDYAKGIVQNRKVIYINVLTGISPDCDCMGAAKKPFVHDIGIVSSDDMIAIDAASADLVDKAYGKFDSFKYETSNSGRYALDYGQQIGLGTKNYLIINK